ncbi:uncharacterized protein LODBEIA_P29130 [Lodderomyces beijingensis]|uniref:Major facilitator superfamily (MFS) profile domain-containing protein n=1 Tax=Lodderomyces beijingensis TaxID=1775926 RepID=A0ABP0ZLD6_9ASCO
MPRDTVLSPVATRVELNDPLNEEFIPGTLNIYSQEIDHEVNKDKYGGDTGDLPRVKTKGNIILFPQPSDSPNDPLNWPSWKKIYNFAILVFITALTAATSNDASSIQDTLNEKYGITYDSMNVGAGVLFLGIGWGTFFLTPLSSLYGRKITYFICIFLGLLGAVWFALCKRTSDTIWSQLFVGISESCAEAQVQLSLSELYFMHNLGTVLTFYILATSIGTYLGPLIASFIVEGINFRYVGWMSVFISAGTLIVIAFVMDETYFDRLKFTVQTQVLDGVSSRKLSTEQEQEDSNMKKLFSTLTKELKTSDEEDHAPATPQPQLSQEKPVFIETADEGADDPPKSYWQSVQMITPTSNLKGTGFKQYCKRLKSLLKVFLFPPVIFSGLVWGMQDALLTFYITVEDDTYYDPPYNYGDTKVGLMNVPCLIGAVIGCICAGNVSDYFSIFLAKRNSGIQEAEFRLWFLIPPAFIAPVGLILFAVGTDHYWHWVPTYIGLGMVGFGFGCAGDVSMSYLMDAYPDMVIEMMTGVAVINNCIGCIFTFACSPWLDAMGNIKTFIILAVLEFVVMLGAVPFIIYGKRVRIWTKQWYLDFIAMRDGKQ